MFLGSVLIIEHEGGPRTASVILAVWLLCNAQFL